MNILILNASPRADGNSVRLIEAFRKGLSADCICEQLDLYSMLPMPCIACNACKQQDTCRFSDLDDFDAALRQADVLVWAIPVYNYSVPSPAKAVLDRFQRYYEAHERNETLFEKTGRPCILLLSAGRAGLYSVDIIRKQLQTACRYTGFELTRTVFAANTDAGSLDEAVLLQASQAAGQITTGEQTC